MHTLHAHTFHAKSRLVPIRHLKQRATYPGHTGHLSPVPAVPGERCGRAAILETRSRHLPGPRLSAVGRPPDSVCGMAHLSDDECQELNECAVNPLRRGEVAQMSRDVEAVEYTNDGPVILGPGLPPEDGSCGQFAVQFHLTTTTVAGLKRIADARGLSVPELCRQVVGVFVAQQEGDLGALLAAEAEVADYRPSLRRS